MLVYNFLIYTWPNSLLKYTDRWIWNFIWSGDVNYKNMVIVDWHKVCTPIDEERLGIRSLGKINEPTSLKLCWDHLHSTLKWIIFLMSTILKYQFVIRYHIFFSIWSGLKNKHEEVINNSCWLFCDDHSINFWKDAWCIPPYHIYFCFLIT